jgi:phage shock protein E
VHAGDYRYHPLPISAQLTSIIKVHIMLSRIFSLGALLALFGCGGPSHTEAQLAALASVEKGALLVDVRSKQEFQGGHLDGALNIPHTQIVEGLAKLGIPKDQPVVLYCRSGNRSGQALVSLQKAGYGQVVNAGDYRSLTSAAAALASPEPSNG